MFAVAGTLAALGDDGITSARESVSPRRVQTLTVGLN